MRFAAPALLPAWAVSIIPGKVFPKVGKEDFSRFAGIDKGRLYYKLVILPGL